MLVLVFVCEDGWMCRLVGFQGMSWEVCWGHEVRSTLAPMRVFWVKTSWAVALSFGSVWLRVAGRLGFWGAWLDMDECVCVIVKG